MLTVSHLIQNIFYLSIDTDIEWILYCLFYILILSCGTWHEVKATTSTSWKAMVWMSNRTLLFLVVTVIFGAHIQV